MKYIFNLLICSALLIGHIQAQQKLNLDSCIAISVRMYPLQNQFKALALMQTVQVENNQTTWYPQINLLGQASYQSDVTSIPISLPNIEIPSLDKDQYKINVDLYQTLYNEGAIAAKKNLIAANTIIENQKINIELYQVKQRIIQLYFGVLLGHEQLKQISLVESDIQNAKKKISAAIQLGTAYKTNLNMLLGEETQLQQKRIELKYQIQLNQTLLSKYLQIPIDSNTIFELPPLFRSNNIGLRPEMALLKYQIIGLNAQRDLIDTKRKPKAGIFMQAGFGKPGLNFLDNSFRPFWIAGIRAQWNLTEFYTNQREKNLLKLQEVIIYNQESVFKFNQDQQITQQELEFQKYKDLITKDQELIQLRRQIKETAMVQLENGIITSSDFLKELNAESLAAEEMSLHQIRLHMIQYQIQFLQNGYPSN